MEIPVETVLQLAGVTLPGHVVPGLFRARIGSTGSLDLICGTDLEWKEHSLLWARRSFVKGAGSAGTI